MLLFIWEKSPGEPLMQGLENSEGIRQSARHRRHVSRAPGPPCSTTTIGPQVPYSRTCMTVRSEEAIFHQLSSAQLQELSKSPDHLVGRLHHPPPGIGQGILVLLQTVGGAAVLHQDGVVAPVTGVGGRALHSGVGQNSGDHKVLHTHIA